MQYYLDGQQISAELALHIITGKANGMGYAREDWTEAWNAKEHSEEAREMLNEISDYRVEFVTND